MVLAGGGVQPGCLDGGVDRRRAAEARAVLVGTVAPGGLPAADAVDVDDAADRLPVVDQRPGRAIKQVRELRQRQDAVDAVAELARLGLVRIEAGGHDDRADADGDGAGTRAADSHVHVVVAEPTRLPDDVGAGEHRDGGPLPDLRDEAGDQRATVLAVRVHLAESAHPSAERLLALDHHDLEADVGEPDRGPEPCDPSADYQGTLGHRNGDLMQLFVGY